MQVCVAVDPPPSMGQVRQFCVCRNGAHRIALHVQGESYWTPATFGLYSQVVPIEHMFISSRIWLILANLSLPQPWDPATETAPVFQHAERADDAVEKSSGQWIGHAQRAIYWPIDREQATGVAATCEQLTVVGIILPTSLDHFYLPPGQPYVNGTVTDTLFTQGHRD